MLVLLTALLFASPPPLDGYKAWIDRNDTVHLRFYNTSLGSPRRIYIHPTVQPTCSVCPSGPDPTITLIGGQFAQEWHGGGKWVEANFPVTAVGGLRTFYFSATADASPPPGESYIDGGPCPN